MILNFEIITLIMINFFYVHITMLILSYYVERIKNNANDLLIYLCVCFGSVVSVIHIINRNEYIICLILFLIVLFFWLKKKLNTYDVCKILLMFYFLTFIFTLLKKFLYKCLNIHPIFNVDNIVIILIISSIAKIYISLLVYAIKFYINKSRFNKNFKIMYLFDFILTPFIVTLGCRVSFLIFNVNINYIDKILLFVFNMNLIFIINFIIMNMNLKQNYYMYKEDYRVNYYKDLILRFSNYVDEIKKIRHDFKHHILIMNSMVNDKKYDTLSEYVKNIFNDNKFNINIFVTTGNSLIDAIINNKLNKASVFDIKFFNNICIPSNLKINEFELGVVLGNTLDNAIEATKKLEYKKRYIDIFIKYYTNETLIIIIKNTYDGKKEFTSKKTCKIDVENHGIGLDVVREIMERNNGFFEIKYDNNFFEYKIMFYGIHLEIYE